MSDVPLPVGLLRGAFHWAEQRNQVQAAAWEMEWRTLVSSGNAKAVMGLVASLAVVMLVLKRSAVYVPGPLYWNAPLPVQRYPNLSTTARMMT